MLATNLGRRWLFMAILATSALVSTAWAETELQRIAGPQRADIVVVGSGPGGLVAALSALKSLRKSPRYQGTGQKPRVVVLEKRGDLPSGADFRDAKALKGTAFSRMQVIGVKPEIMAMLKELGVDLGARKASVQILGNKQEAPTSYTIMINELQAKLAEVAKREGIELKYGTGFSGLDSRSDGRVTVKTDGSTDINARWVIGGDGAGSRVRSAIGMKQNTGTADGIMAGVWFKGVRGSQRIVRRQRHEPGSSGILLAEQKQLYGLFALPPHLAKLVQDARDNKRTLTPREERQIMRHAERIAKRLLPGRDAKKLRADFMQSFPIVLNRVLTTVSRRHNAVLIGDAVQTVNPYSGSGANIAMKMGELAGRTLVQVTDTPGARNKRRLLGKYDRAALREAKTIHEISRDFVHTFRAAEHKPLLSRLTGSLKRAVGLVRPKTVVAVGARVLRPLRVARGARMPVRIRVPR